MTRSDQAVADVNPQTWPGTPRATAEIILNGENFFWSSVQERVDITADSTKENGEYFARELADLALKVRDRSPDDWQDDAKLDEALRLDGALVSPYRDTWRRLGVGLRTAVKSAAGALKEAGYLQLGRLEQKPITVCEPVDPSLGKPTYPLWCELIYEGDTTGKPEWSRFWGFWVPLTHWLISHPRQGEIRLDRGLFTAVDHRLSFAPLEVERLHRQIAEYRTRYQGAWDSTSLDEALRQKLQDRVDQLPAPQPPFPGIGAGKDESWLQNVLPTLAEPDEYETLISEQMRAIFKSSPFPYELIHFACHFDPTAGPPALAKMTLHTGGRPIELWAEAFREWRRKERYARNDPGALVFLNACGTAAPQSSEPPVFPVRWIMCQGAIAVIATLCPVPDYFAFAFARQFYRFLFEAIEHPEDPQKAVNAYVAEALTATRRHFLEAYNNPLGLAYVCYAAADAHVVAPAKRQEAVP